jgi:hypothetical protein
MKRLDTALKYLYNPIPDFLICGDINVDYLNDNKQKKQNSLLTTNNFSPTINLAIRTQNHSSTVTDNIFVDITRQSSSSISPIVNGLSDHHVQFLTVNNVVPATNIILLKHRTREINN